MVDEFKVGEYYLCIDNCKKQLSYLDMWLKTAHKFTRGFFYGCDNVGLIDDLDNHVPFEDVDEINGIKPYFEEVNFKVDDEIIFKIKEKKNRINSPINDILIQPLIRNFTSDITIYRCFIFFNRAVCSRFSIDSIGPSQMEAYQNTIRDFKKLVMREGRLKRSLSGKY